MKKLHVVVAFLNILLALAGVSTARAAEAQQIIFAHGAAPGNPRHEGALKFKEIIESKSDGRLSCVVAPNSSLGDDAEMLKSVEAGKIQITANSQGTFSKYVPEVAALGLPFLFSSVADAWNLVEGPIGKELEQLARKKGFVVLAWWDNGLRHISHVSKPIRNAEDLKGVKIRTPPDKATMDIFTALAAQPAPLPWSKLPEALRTGQFEAQENPLTNIYSAGIQKFTPYISLTAHKYEVTPVVASVAWFDSLSPTDQDIVKNAAVQAGWYQRSLSVRDEHALQDILVAEGAHVSSTNISELKARAAVVYDIWRRDYPDFVNRLLIATGNTLYAKR